MAGKAKLLDELFINRISPCWGVTATGSGNCWKLGTRKASMMRLVGAETRGSPSAALQGFKKPIIMTGSQLPLVMPRSDARQNLIGSSPSPSASPPPPFFLLL